MSRGHVPIYADAVPHQLYKKSYAGQDSVPHILGWHDEGARKSRENPAGSTTHHPHQQQQQAGAARVMHPSISPPRCEEQAQAAAQSQAHSRRVEATQREASPLPSPQGLLSQGGLTRGVVGVANPNPDPPPPSLPCSVGAGTIGAALPIPNRVRGFAEKMHGIEELRPPEVPERWGIGNRILPDRAAAKPLGAEAGWGIGNRILPPQPGHPTSTPTFVQHAYEARELPAAGMVYSPVTAEGALGAGGIDRTGGETAGFGPAYRHLLQAESPPRAASPVVVPAPPATGAGGSAGGVVPWKLDARCLLTTEEVSRARMVKPIVGQHPVS